MDERDLEIARLKGQIEALQSVIAMQQQMIPWLQPQVPVVLPTVNPMPWIPASPYPVLPSIQPSTVPFWQTTTGSIPFMPTTTSVLDGPSAMTFDGASWTSSIKTSS